MKNYSMSAFDGYVSNIDPSLVEIDDLLAAMLPDNPEQLTVQLRKAEAFYAYANGVAADANAYLDVAEGASLPPKGSGTELDRKAAQVEAVAPIRAFRNRMEGVCKAINLRLMLGMSLLKHHESERRGLGATTGQ